MTTYSEQLGPPYLPYSTFRTALETLHQGLPMRLDRSVWPSQSGGIQSQLLKAFRFLRLTSDSDEVGQRLYMIVNGSEEERRNLLADAFLDAYPRVIDLAANSGSTQQLHDAFTAMGVTGDTRRKAETFFLQAAEELGIRQSPHWPSTKKRVVNNRPARRSGTKTGTKPASRSRRPAPVVTTASTPQASSSSGNAKVIDLANGGKVTLIVDVDWLTVPPDDRTWLLELIDKLNEYPETLEL